mmetsp:Transcript_24190/g.55014  ORF Transcript_24190/g.55014 Transcript_24190/m.55014 type:complete len:125 (-) Transcript_24190:1091-1465(-)
MLFSIQDPRLGTTSRKTHPNWKVKPLLKHSLSVCKEAIAPGCDLAVDKQTIGFQGQHRNKKRIDEKKVGDGFQYDLVNCNGGYTYAFYFRNQPPPDKYIKKVMSPLHAPTLSLLAQLPGKHHHV